MIECLWGLKTIAFLDVWSIEHLLSGISVGKIVSSLHQCIYTNLLGSDRSLIRTSYFDLIGVLFLAYFWETTEHYLETGLMGSAVSNWFQGIEFWGNRLITDPLVLVIGYYLGQHFPFLVTYARLASCVWLIIHIFVFPHSMYLHTLFQ